MPPNRPPTVSFVQPASGADSTAPADLHVVVRDDDPDGRVVNVRLYLNEAFVRQESLAPWEWGSADQDDQTVQNMPMCARRGRSNRRHSQGSPD
ncbi:MAG: hypothetical protein EA424_00875 [Planctomycetaceae bacterium]|nr:MAG: hypothetical protein EA424_00875 [Planctomycetaceae bacterium]